MQEHRMIQSLVQTAVSANAMQLLKIDCLILCELLCCIDIAPG